jgi:hypothetical protein
VSSGRGEARGGGGGGGWYSPQSADVNSLVHSSANPSPPHSASSRQFSDGCRPPPTRSDNGGSRRSSSSGGSGRNFDVWRRRQSLQQQAWQLLKGPGRTNGGDSSAESRQGGQKSSSPQKSVSKGVKKSGKNSEAAGEGNKKEKRGKNPPEGQVETGAQRGREREFKRLQRQTEDLIGGFKYSKRSEVALVSPPPSSADWKPETEASGGGGRNRFWKSRSKNNNNNNNNKETLHSDRKDR